MSGDLVSNIQQTFNQLPTTRPAEIPAPGVVSTKPAYNNWDDYWDSNGYYRNRTTPKHGKSYTPIGYTPPPTKKIAVVGEDGQVSTYMVPYDCEGWFTLAASVWPVTDHIMQVPRAHCQFSYSEPPFNACVYTATNDYMQARWGRRLDDSDRRWLAAHPYATDGGIPQEYTATCVGQLVEPYGMRVSRVRLRKGSLVLGESVMGWIQALGCNPFAMADRSTSNAEAAARMGMSVQEADALWRVEFHDNPLPCSIVGERGWSNGTGVVTGSMGGHARYLAPRASAGDWFISVQLDAAVQYLIDPPAPEYVPRKGTATLLIGSITGPTGQLIATRVNHVWKAVDESAAAVTTPPAQSVTPQAEPRAVTVGPAQVVSAPLSPTEAELFVAPEANAPFRLTTPVVCGLCGDTCHESVDVMTEADVCQDCLRKAWRGLECPHCQVSFSSGPVPSPESETIQDYEWSCPHCHQLIVVPGTADSGDPLYELAVLSWVVYNDGFVSNALGR